MSHKNLRAPVTLSERFKAALRDRRGTGVRYYTLAAQARLHPSVFSTVVNEMVPIYENDGRIVRIGTVLGLNPGDCFDGVRKPSGEGGGAVE